MGFKFRKSIKILPGLKINLTHKGISSASIGKAGASVNSGKKGTRTSIGIPGTGLSYSKHRPYTNKPNTLQNSSQQPPLNSRSIERSRSNVWVWIILFYCRGNSFLEFAALFTHNIPPARQNLIHSLLWMDVKYNKGCR